MSNSSRINYSDEESNSFKIAEESNSSINNFLDKDSPTKIYTVNLELLKHIEDKQIDLFNQLEKRIKIIEEEHKNKQIQDLCKQLEQRINILEEDKIKNQHLVDHLELKILIIEEEKKNDIKKIQELNRELEQKKIDKIQSLYIELEERTKLIEKEQKDNIGIFCKQLEQRLFIIEKEKFQTKYYHDLCQKLEPKIILFEFEREKIKDLSKQLAEKIDTVILKIADFYSGFEKQIEDRNKTTTNEIRDLHKNLEQKVENLNKFFLHDSITDSYRNLEQKIGEENDKIQNLCKQLEKRVNNIEENKSIQDFCMQLEQKVNNIEKDKYQIQDLLKEKILEEIKIENNNLYKELENKLVEEYELKNKRNKDISLKKINEYKNKLRSKK